MSKFNTYAQQLDAAFKTARGEYVEAYQRFQQAQQANCRANVWTPNESAAEKQVKTARAAACHCTMQRLLLPRQAPAFGVTSRPRAACFAQSWNRKYAPPNLVNPDAIDSNALELLKSGVLTSDDYAAFMEKYDSNPTMLKLLAHYAAEAAKATDSRREAATLNAISIDCQSGQSTVLRAFDDICKISDYCRGEKHVGDQIRPEHAVNMSSRWEELTSEAVENF